MEEAIDALRNWPENWDGNESSKPQTASIDNAKSWLKSIIRTSYDNKLNWIEPLISADEGGNIVSEWWNKSKKLTLDFQPLMADYTKIFDFHTSPRISNGSLGGRNEREQPIVLELMKWILS